MCVRSCSWASRGHELICSQRKVPCRYGSCRNQRLQSPFSLHPALSDGCVSPEKIRAAKSIVIFRPVFFPGEEIIAAGSLLYQAGFASVCHMDTSFLSINVCPFRTIALLLLLYYFFAFRDAAFARAASILGQTYSSPSLSVNPAFCITFFG